MESRKEDNTLYVKMFGGFSMTWHKKPVGGGAKSSETQFNYLMQLLLHHRAEGISRSHLEQALFGDQCH